MNTILLKSPKRSRLFSAVLIATFIAGTLDICAASLQYFIKTGKGPEGVLRFVASGVFGKAAFKGDGMVLYGLLFHYLVAFGFTVLFFVIYPKLKHFLKYNVLIGALYGLVIWIVMNLLVLPLTNVPVLPFTINSAVIAAVILIIAIGIPLAYLAKRYYQKNHI